MRRKKATNEKKSAVLIHGLMAFLLLVEIKNLEKEYIFEPIQFLQSQIFLEKRKLKISIR